MPNQQKSKNFLRDISQNCFPVLGKNIPFDKLVPLNLSSDNLELSTLLSQNYKDIDSYSKAIQGYIDKVLPSKNSIGIGGYLERRSLYQKSPYFEGIDEERNIHLGIDLWTAANCPVYAVLDGILHSSQYNDNILDYGGTVILEHIWGNQQFYCLYGHLSKKSVEMVVAAKQINKGSKIGHLGTSSENGGWPPHLHFQIILDLEGMQGDYPGVSSNNKVDFYKTNCPDPGPLLQII